MAEAKKVTVEITNKVVLPKSVYETKHVAKLADRGDVIDVYEDVADKLVLYKNATRVTKDSPASIKETEEKNAKEEKERRENLIKDKSKK